MCAVGRTRDDTEDREIQEREADGEREIEAPRVVIDRVGDGLVRKIDLECADDLAVLVVREMTFTVDSERNVDRQQALVRSVVELLRRLQVRDLGCDASREALVQLVVAGKPSLQQSLVVGPHDEVVRVPDLESNDVVPRQAVEERGV